MGTCRQGLFQSFGCHSRLGIDRMLQKRNIVSSRKVFDVQAKALHGRCAGNGVSEGVRRDASHIRNGVHLFVFPAFREPVMRFNIRGLEPGTRQRRVKVGNGGPVNVFYHLHGRKVCARHEAGQGG